MKKAIKYCMDNNVLKQFLETHGSEVFNMLLTEWNLEEAIAVNREDAWEEGREKTQEEIARNALAEGFSLETVHKITGLDIQAIQNIQAGL